MKKHNKILFFSIMKYFFSLKKYNHTMRLCYLLLGKNMIYLRSLTQKYCSFLWLLEISLFWQNEALFLFFSL